MNNESSLRTWQWITTAIIVVILIVIGIMVFTNDRPAQVDEVPTIAEDEEIAPWGEIRCTGEGCDDLKGA